MPVTRTIPDTIFTLVQREVQKTPAMCFALDTSGSMIVSLILLSTGELVLNTKYYIRICDAHLKGVVSRVVSKLV